MSRDRLIRRCPICGEWAWRGVCYVQHKTIEKEAA